MNEGFAVEITWKSGAKLLYGPLKTDGMAKHFARGFRKFKSIKRACVVRRESGDRQDDQDKGQREA